MTFVKGLKKAPTNIQPEKVEHIKVVEWLRQKTDLPYLHIANERKTTIQHNIMLKKMGVRAGVSDLFLPRGNEHFSGLWLEMKAPGGRITNSQVKFLKDMRDEGYETAVCYSSEEAIEFIKDFYEIVS